LAEGQHLSSRCNWPWLPRRWGFFVIAGTNGNRLGFAAKERMRPMPKTERNHDPQTSDKKYFETTIGDLRKLHGANFAKDCAENETIADVLQRRPSFTRLIRYHERKRNEGKYSETTIGDLRRLYGPEFARGCADNEKIADVLRKIPSLMRVIRHRERKWFEQI
jgi:hypothetical protein